MAVGLLQERGLLHRLLDPAFTSEQEHQRVERDAQVEPERGVMTYQSSSASFSSVVTRLPPLIWAQPVIPERTIRRKLLLEGRSLRH